MIVLDQVASLTESERAALADYLTQLHEVCGSRLLRVVLFGSKARGDSERDSDIDLLLVLRGDPRRFEERLADLSYNVSLYHGIVLSDFVVGERRYRWMSRHREPLLETVELEGVELWRDENIERSSPAASRGVTRS